MTQPNSTFVALELYQTKVKGVSVPAGTRGFHGSEKVWVHTHGCFAYSASLAWNGPLK